MRKSAKQLAKERDALARQLRQKESEHRRQQLAEAKARQAHRKASGDRIAKEEILECTLCFFRFAAERDFVAHQKAAVCVHPRTIGLIEHPLSGVWYRRTSNRVKRFKSLKAREARKRKREQQLMGGRGLNDVPECPHDGHPDDLAAWVACSRQRQGLPEKVSDPSVLNRVASLLGGGVR